MATGLSLHTESECNDAHATAYAYPQPDTDADPSSHRVPLSPPLEPPPVLRRKGRKKSIRNTKDSAEMARHRYQREQQQSHSLPQLHQSHKVMDRHFSVANVGQNGTVYLRPVARPYPRAFRPPPTPPDTSDPQQSSPSPLYWHDGLHQSAAALVLPGPQHHTNLAHRRSSFDSSYSQESRRGERLPRVRSPSLDSISKKPLPPIDSPKSHTSHFLEVPIPNFRLGSPRFSDRGTAFLHNSYHTAFSSTTDLRQLSTDRLDPLIAATPQRHQNSIDLRRSPSVSWFSPSVTPAAEVQGNRLRPSPLASPPLELHQDEIPHTIYDKVDTNPDSPEYVRYADGTRDIVAATPTRLIAEITSVKFLDYDLLSDFFLTYRAFLSPSDLARYLVARLRWAVSQTNESGRIVRVRSFVALRHWTLNYFTQDFEPDHELRVLFCNLVNELASDLARKPEGGRDLQVLRELQKCWNRTCALVWGPVEAPQSYMPVRQDVDDDSCLPGAVRMRTLTTESHYRNTYMGGNMSTTALRRPETGSRLSEASIQVTSCSFPRLKRSKPDLKHGVNKSGHRSPSKPKGPFHRHKRSDSFSDALRDSRLDRPTLSHQTAELQIRPGRIIRGLVIHPSSANVVGPGPPSPPFLVEPEDARPSMSETLLRPLDHPSHHARLNIFGSMRRALSTRNGGKSPFHIRPKTANLGDFRRPRDPEAQPKDMIRQIHARKAQGIHTDALAAMVIRSWEQQGNEVEYELEEFGSNPAIIRNRSRTIHTEVPTRPSPARLHSNLTTSSRSIVIVDDTGLDESERTPDLEHTLAGFERSATRPYTERQRTQGNYQAATRNAASKDTAFLMPYETFNHELQSWSSPTSMPFISRNTLSLISAPRSPPPSVPLPPLPTEVGSSTKPDSSGDSIQPSPDTEITASLGTAELGSPNDSVEGSASSGFRKSSLVDPSELSGPIRQLRRRPGGNLRVADTVQDLSVIPRRQSTGSLSSPVSLYSSCASPAKSGDAGAEPIPARIMKHRLRAQATDGDLFEAARKSSLRLLSTHSSMRHLRPSMEIEVAKFREMPHVEDDGGVESALLKLEGRFVPSRSSDKTLRSFTFGDDHGDSPKLTRQDEREVLSTQARDHDHDMKGTIAAERTEQTLVESPLIGGDVNRFAHRRHQAIDTPAADHTVERSSATNPPIATKDFAITNRVEESDRPMTPITIERSSSPITPASTFLLDDGESLADRNSILARNHETKPSTDTDRSFFFDEEDDDAIAGSAENHQPPQGHHPLTPPTTADTLSDHGFDDFNAQLLLPGPPSSKPRKSFRLSELLLSEQFAKKAEHSALPRPRNLPTQHTPFILAHSSEALALQFTMIEKDALDSVDWKDLINLNWSQKVPSVRDWAQYIHSFPANITEISSIDLIITRFNLVIKWCISSVLLCSTPEERAECITKFIHIATYAHRVLRNFATTAQITIALLSSDLARLGITWTKVAEAEKDALKNLETLVSPMRNFAVLRAEMEGAAAELGDDEVSAGKGVIPFLGVYTRDLALNAQKPAFISPSVEKNHEIQEKLVNFERHRTTASIVKGVLRLLDASSRYAIKSDAEVLAKCLWLAALADSEIAELSKGLER